MRFVLALTRGLISFATTLHIQGLRGAVYFDDRKVAKAMKATDAAKAAESRARADLHLAADSHASAIEAERTTLRDNAAFRQAAMADAQNYRRLVWF